MYTVSDKIIAFSTCPSHISFLLLQEEYEQARPLHNLDCSISITNCVHFNCQKKWNMSKFQNKHHTL